MSLHLIYCDTRRDAHNELHLQRCDIKNQKPGIPPTLYDDKGLVGEITAALGIVDCYSPTWDEEIGVLPGSEKYTTPGCRWAVLIEVKEAAPQPVASKLLAMPAGAAKSATPPVPMASLVPINKLKVGDQIFLHKYNEWFTISEIRSLRTVKFFPKDDWAFTRWLVTLDRDEYVVRR